MKIIKGNKWYYHPEHGAKLAWREEEKTHYAEGWYDTPDDFPNEESSEVPEFANMSKREIDDYANTLGIELDRRKTKENMLEDLIKQLEG